MLRFIVKKFKDTKCVGVNVYKLVLLATFAVQHL